MPIVEIIAVVFFLCAVSYQDIRSREISLRICVCFGVIGIIITLVTGWQNDGILTEVILAVVPGIIMLIVSYLTNQSVGMGDGVVVLVMGIYLGIEKTIGVLLLGMMLVAVFSMMLLITKRVKKEYELPLIPFLSIVAVWMIGGC